MYGLDLINTSVLGALGCDMNTFLRYFPAAETMYSLLVALSIGLIQMCIRDRAPPGAGRRDKRRRPTEFISGGRR